MSAYYFDTSALVKRYVREVGSDWVDNLLNAQNDFGKLAYQVVFSRLAIVETTSAIARSFREGKLSKSWKDELVAKFYEDLQIRYRLISVTDDLIVFASELTLIHTLRGYDATHLATALQFNRILLANRSAPLIFLSADANLLKAAAAEGLQTDNPNLHETP